MRGLKVWYVFFSFSVKTKETQRSLNLLNISPQKRLLLSFELFNLSPTGPPHSDPSPHAICQKTAVPPATSGICNTLKVPKKSGEKKEAMDWWLARLLVCWYSFTRVKCNGRENKSWKKKNGARAQEGRTHDGLLTMWWITFAKQHLIFLSSDGADRDLTKRKSQTCATWPHDCPYANG